MGTLTKPRSRQSVKKRTVRHRSVTLPYGDVNATIMKDGTVKIVGIDAGVKPITAPFRLSSRQMVLIGKLVKNSCSSRLPNDETLKAMQECNEGKLKRYTDKESFYSDLDR